MQQKTKGQTEQEQGMEAFGLTKEDIVLLYDECNERLVEVENDLLDVLQDKAVISAEFTNRVFRAFHTVKGSAAFVLNEPMKELSHKAENVLGEVREKRIALTPPLAEVLLAAVSRLTEMANDVDRRLEIDCNAEIDKLDAILNTANSAQVVLPPLSGAVPKAPQRPSLSRRLKVLVVEDELTSRLILQDLLSKYGDCHVAVDGNEAVEAFRAAVLSQKRYDLICMDIRMPVMEGTDAVRKIRAIEESQRLSLSASVKIFMTTSIQDMKTITASYKALCDTYLFKPIDGAQLNEHLRAFGLLDQKEK